MEREYTVLTPIKQGKPMSKEEREGVAAFPGQAKPTHEGELVSEGVVTLSEEDAAPLLEAGAIRPASYEGSGPFHDPDVVGYEGAARRDAAQNDADPNSPEVEAEEQAKPTGRQSSTAGK